VLVWSIIVSLSDKRVTGILRRLERVKEPSPAG
jgi:hypothetical protein